MQASKCRVRALFQALGGDLPRPNSVSTLQPCCCRDLARVSVNPALAQLVLTSQDCGGASLTLCVTEEATGAQRRELVSSPGSHHEPGQGSHNPSLLEPGPVLGHSPPHLSVQSGHCLSTSTKELGPWGRERAPEEERENGSKARPETRDRD